MRKKHSNKSVSEPQMPRPEGREKWRASIQTLFKSQSVWSKKKKTEKCVKNESPSKLHETFWFENRLVCFYILYIVNVNLKSDFTCIEDYLLGMLY